MSSTQITYQDRKKGSPTIRGSIRLAAPASGQICARKQRPK